MSVEIYTPIAHLQPGNYITQIFLISEIERKKTKAQVTYAIVTLKDISGTIKGLIWKYDDSLKPNTYAKLCIETTQSSWGDETISFKCSADDILGIDLEVPANEHDYVVGVKPDALRLLAQDIEKYINSIQDDDYRNLMRYAAEKLGVIGLLMESPYGLKGPLAHKGGLLIHTRHTLIIAHAGFDEAEELAEVSDGLIIAGCILRNIGWNTTTICKGTTIHARDAYYMIGTERASERFIDHLFLSYEADTQQEFPESKKQALQNCVMELAKSYTLEAQMVASADNLATIIEEGTSKLKLANRGNWKSNLFFGHIQ